MSDQSELLKRQERILRELGKKQDLGMVLGAQADLLVSNGQLAPAVEKLAEAENLFRETGDLYNVGRALSQQVRILQHLEEPAKLLGVLQRQESFSRNHGDEEDIAEGLLLQARAAHAQGDLDSEMRLLAEQEPIWRKLQNDEKTALCLGSRAMCLLRLNRDLEAALKLVEEEVQICRTLEDPALLARSVNTQALVLHKLGRIREAIAKAEECHQLAEQAGDDELHGRVTSLLGVLRQSEVESKELEFTKRLVGATSIEEQSNLFREFHRTSLKSNSAAWLREQFSQTFDFNIMAAVEYLEELIARGEPVADLAAQAITSMVDCPGELPQHWTAKIEILLAYLESGAHRALATPLRQQFSAKRGTNEKP